MSEQMPTCASCGAPRLAGAPMCGRCWAPFETADTHPAAGADVVRWSPPPAMVATNAGTDMAARSATAVAVIEPANPFADEPHRRLTGFQIGKPRRRWPHVMVILVVLTLLVVGGLFGWKHFSGTSSHDTKASGALRPLTAKEKHGLAERLAQIQKDDGLPKNSYWLPSAQTPVEAKADVRAYVSKFDTRLRAANASLATTIEVADGWARGDYNDFAFGQQLQKTIRLFPSYDDLKPPSEALTDVGGKLQSASFEMIHMLISTSEWMFSQDPKLKAGVYKEAAMANVHWNDALTRAYEESGLTRPPRVHDDVR